MALHHIFAKKPRPKVKSRLSTFVDIHDPHTIEINSSFDLGKEPLRGETELVLFFPRSLKLAEIHKHSLTHDFQIRMRLSNRGREKKIKLHVEEILTKLEAMVPKTEDAERPSPTELQQLTQNVGVLIGDWMSHHQISFKKKVATLGELQTAEDFVRVIASGSRGLDNFDSVVVRVRKLYRELGDNHGQPLQLLNFYISQKYLLYLDTLTIAVHESLRLSEQFALHQLAPIYEVKRRIDEIKTREAHDPESPLLLENSRTNQQLLEERLIMLGYLKKFFQSDAFIDLKEKMQKERIFETISIVAAGIAGLIAAIAGLLLMNREKIFRTDGTFFDSIAFMDASNIAAQSTSFILIFGTVAYIFRDRIKEQSKKYLHKRLSNVLPDNQAELQLKSVRLGEMRSWLQVNPDRGLPTDISALRSSACLMEAEKYVPEDIVYLKRHFELDPLKSKKKEVKQSLHDIVRFNFHRTLRFMDAAIKPISVLREDGTIEKTFTSRNYLVYLIVESRIRNSTGESLVVESKKVFRVVINKDGIQRLELVRKSKQKNLPFPQNKKLTFLSPLI